jgi:hypothetical protein
MMKTVDFLGTQVTRMTIGDNPFHGNTYIHDIYTWHDFVDYYTADQCVKALFAAEESGINTFIALASPFTLRVIHQYKNEGGKMHIMFQTYPAMDLEACINQMMIYNPVAIYHQGSTFDDMLETGRIDLAHKRLEMLRKGCPGVKIGFATHVPEVVIQAEEEKWDVDFYKTCIYNTRRSQRGQQSGFITGKTKHLVMYHDDRLLMFEAIKKVSKPCIAFKIFAGGQVFLNKDEAARSAAAEEAIKETFENIKPGDLTCVGVFQRDKNQIKENADMAKKYL